MSTPTVLFRNSSKDLVTISIPKRYRPSQFNARRVVADGSLVLYNSYSGAFTVFPEASKKRVQAMLSARGVAEGQDQKLLTYLVERGYLVEEKTDELRRVRLMHGSAQHRTDKMELILLASEECNFRCTYCYETFPRGTMEPWVREAVVKWAASRMDRLSHLNIEWFGGEPLLGLDAIRDISPTLKEHAAAHSVRLTQGMTTNGYLLTPETVTDLFKWGITTFQITLDGPAETHNTARVLKEGGDTYDEIITNLIAMHKRTDKFKVILRVNFDRNTVPRIRRHIEAMKQALEGDPRFTMRFRAVGQWGGENDDKIAICDHDALDLKREMEFAALLEGVSAETRKEWLQPQNDQIVCYAARPYSFIVGADGKLMKCTVVLDKKDYNLVGILHPDGRPEIDLDKMASWIAPYFEEDEQCKRCFFLPSCQSCSCPMMKIEDNTRPCPDDKDRIGATLEGIWLAEHIQKTGKRPPSNMDFSHLLDDRPSHPPQ